jgi:hypothetical protein
VYTKSQRGGVLLVVAILITIIFLSLVAKQAMKAMDYRLNKQTGISATLNKIDVAFINYVAQYKRLPCPADGRIAIGQANAGVEMTFPACNTQRYGVVPWVTLGISENDARDPWNGRITYRVDPALAGTGVLLMNMSQCDISGTGSVAAGGACRTPTPTCLANPTTCTSPTTFLTGKGVDVWDGIGGDGGWASRAINRTNGSGAAYVIISHGATGTGAYNSNGIYQTGTLAAGNDELPNLNNTNIAIPASQANTYRNAPFNDSKEANNFDDFVSHPKIQDVLIKANLSHRVH